MNIALSAPLDTLEPDPSLAKRVTQEVWEVQEVSSPDVPQKRAAQEPASAKTRPHPYYESPRLHWEQIKASSLGTLLYFEGMEHFYGILLALEKPTSSAQEEKAYFLLELAFLTSQQLMAFSDHLRLGGGEKEEESIFLNQC